MVNLVAFAPKHYFAGQGFKVSEAINAILNPKEIFFNFTSEESLVSQYNTDLLPCSR